MNSIHPSGKWVENPQGSIEDLEDDFLCGHSLQICDEFCLRKTDSESLKYYLCMECRCKALEHPKTKEFVDVERVLEVDKEEGLYELREKDELYYSTKLLYQIVQFGDYLGTFDDIEYSKFYYVSEGIVKGFIISEGCEIKAISVLPKYRRKGIGKSLAIDWREHEDCDEVKVSSYEEATGFYKSLPFDVVEITGSKESHCFLH